MEELSFQIEKIAGLAREDTECGVINKKIVLGNDEIGTLVCCFLVSDAKEVQPQDIIRDIFEIFEQKLDGASDSVLEILKEATGKSERYLDGQGVEVSFLSLFFYRDVCYVARHGQKVKLVVFEGSKKAEIGFETGSGPVVGGQMYLIATEKFLELFDDYTFKKEDIGLSEIIDGLATEISAQGEQAEIGAVFVEASASREVETDKLSEEDVKQGELIHEDDRVDVGGVDSADNVLEDHEVDDEGQRVSEKVEEVTEKRKSLLAGVKQLQAGFILRGISNFFKELSRIRTGDVRAVLRLRRNILIIVILIAVGLGVFATYQVWQKNEKTRQAELQSHLEAARSKLNEGGALIELNKQRARQILVSAQEEAKKAQQINSKNKDVLSLLEEINNKLKETEITSTINFSTFADLDLSIKALAFNGNKIEAFGSDKIYEVDSGGKVAREYEGFSSGAGGAVFDNKAFVLAGDEVTRLDFTTGSTTKIADSSRVFDIGVFFGNVYILGESQITKYVPIEGGYAEPKDYLEKNEDFGSLSRMAIDSLVWVTKGDKILKFNRGAAETFEISGLPEGKFDFSLIFTDSNLGNIYVVDKRNSVLLVIEKNGEYKRALSSSEFGRASDILVNDAEDKIFLAVDNKILSTGLGK